MTDHTEKLKALQVTIDKLEKTYGRGAVMRLSDNHIVDIPVISTGSLGLDLALGVGGIPRGRIIEIYGPESSGKTTLSLHCIAEAQKKGGLAAFIDAEHAFDKSYAERLGIDTENLLIAQPDDGEQALEIAEHLIRSGSIDILVIDSVAALVPRSELEGDMGDSKMGLQARLMSQALRKLTGTINKTGCACIFINQLREKIGVLFGNPETTTGGNALKFYASVRLDIRSLTSLKESDGTVSGKRTRVKIVKNKVAPPFRVVEFDILYGEGVSKVGELIDIGVELGVVKKAGSWFSYEEHKLAQGREASKELLKDHPELFNKIEADIKAKISDAIHKG
ncbi:MAG: recombinase RecA [Candidatus Cardinium sp.]|uniref:recombinase RecA n=1 Tax=Candidatus Cardinium sp. TP TaxID=2961955 RepID=UPI0021AEE1E8|nr:recombinase RecA [Candidatus Cardinium sp. TP]MCT4697290.1 recombinase RecA [Candidatus Cardinium sp. TP]MDN5247052.1 recombinase RecA [Candidatus Cardinium sp.]